MAKPLTTDTKVSMCTSSLTTKHGPDLVSLKKELIVQISLERIQLVTISRPSAYGEYESYTFVKTEDEMKQAVLHM